MLIIVSILFLLFLFSRITITVNRKEAEKAYLKKLLLRSIAIHEPTQENIDNFTKADEEFQDLYGG